MTDEKNNMDEEKIDEGEKIEVEKDVIENIPKEDSEPVIKVVEVEGWRPKTETGRKVKEGIISDIDDILDKGKPIMESEIVDSLIPDLQNDLLLIGQSKGKFGGGSRRIFKQTQKKTPEGNKPSFSCAAAVGNLNGYVGVGSGKSKDTVPAREKAIRNAKLNIIKIRLGCGSWQCGCKDPHTVPFNVEGKCGSVIIKLMPAPRGTGLCVEDECQKILKLAGIKDVWSKTLGHTKTKMNLINACFEALKKLMEMKIPKKHENIVEGAHQQIIEKENE